MTNIIRDPISEARGANHLISVVMAVYNGKKYLEAQIQSILNQTYQEMELIIIDDASSDGSLQAALEFARGDSRVIVRRNVQNLGVGKNFLSAISFARGELICFSDQDDVWRKDKVSVLSSLLLRDSRNMLAYSDLEICDESLKTIHKSFWKVASVKPRSGMMREQAFLRNIMPGCSMMFRKQVRDLLIQVPKESSLMHDHLAFVVASSLGRIVYSRETLVKYRQHQRNNIGAFYPSVTDKQRFSEQLQAEIKLLSSVLPIDLGRLERFLKIDVCANIFLRAPFVNYYLFLRPDILASKGLGIMECLFPELYRQLRRRYRAD